MGDLFGKRDNELLGFIRSLNYVVPEESTWETEENTRVPKFVMATITYQVIHGEPPNMETSFYGYGGNQTGTDGETLGIGGNVSPTDILQ